MFLTEGSLWLFKFVPDEFVIRLPSCSGANVFEIIFCLPGKRSAPDKHAGWRRGASYPAYDTGGRFYTRSNTVAMP